jgi:hypothetical protein
MIVEESWRSMRIPLELVGRSLGNRKKQRAGISPALTLRSDQPDRLI